MKDCREYRTAAAEFLDLAQRASDPEVATIYRRLASLYQRLVNWPERQEEAPNGRQPLAD